MNYKNLLQCDYKNHVGLVCCCCCYSVFKDHFRSVRPCDLRSLRDSHSKLFLRSCQRFSLLNFVFAATSVFRLIRCSKTEAKYNITMPMSITFFVKNHISVDEPDVPSNYIKENENCCFSKAIIVP